MHGTTKLFASAGRGCCGDSGARVTTSITLDNTPIVTLYNPSDGQSISGPFDIKGRVVFKPWLNPSPHYIRVNLFQIVEESDLYFFGATKSCLVEECAFSYKDLTGDLIAVPSNHKYKVIATAMEGDIAIVTHNFLVADIPSMANQGPPKCDDY